MPLDRWRPTCRTRACPVVTYAGVPCDMAALEQLRQQFPRGIRTTAPALGGGERTPTDEAKQEEAQAGPARPKRSLKPSARVCGPEWVNYM